ncbi:hypothetical protein EVAR_22414_1 [Eumeta japonica]|uniref:Uncharacterized protein n=1 Tax=Eumeta variegata TaxID=151549 RepID=A0A4C1SHK2_EUMVA|nr:hypothetical protein EVAR_22414_1 [Eumeta japonica]
MIKNDEMMMETTKRKAYPVRRNWRATESRAGTGIEIEIGNVIETECRNGIRIKSAIGIEIKNNTGIRIEGGNEMVLTARSLHLHTRMRAISDGNHHPRTLATFEESSMRCQPFKAGIGYLMEGESATGTLIQQTIYNSRSWYFVCIL